MDIELIQFDVLRCLSLSFFVAAAGCGEEYLRLVSGDVCLPSQVAGESGHRDDARKRLL